MKEFEKKILAFCQREKLFEPGEKVLVALSGGPDSVALLCCLLALKKELHIVPIAAHLNHKIRKTADCDELFCESLSQKFGVPFFSKALDVPQIASEDGTSLETCARKLRYEFFEEVQKEENADKIALAHHVDDQAETFLMHLLRGAGTKGLGGMEPKRSMLFVRPFLEVTKAQILAYLSELQQSYCVDETNFSDEFLRNRVRLHLLPELLAYNKNITGLLAQTATMLKDEHEYIKEEAISWLSSHQEDGEVSTDAFLSLPAALQRQVLREGLKSQTNTLRDVSFSQIEMARELISSKKPGKIMNFSSHVALVTSYDTFFWKSEEIAPLKEESYVLKLNEVYESALLNTTFELSKVSVLAYQKMKKEASWEAFDAKILEKPIEVRTFKPGDRISPFGMNGTKKVQDLFTDQKIPRFNRSKIPLLVCDGKVIWIAGVRRSRDFLVLEHTKEVVIIRITGGKRDA